VQISEPRLPTETRLYYLLCVMQNFAGMWCWYFLFVFPHRYNRIAREWTQKYAM